MLCITQSSFWYIFLSTIYVIRIRSNVYLSIFLGLLTLHDDLSIVRPKRIEHVILHCYFEKNWDREKNPCYMIIIVSWQISFADYAVFDLIYNHEVYAPGCLNDLPLLKAFIDRMKARENLAKYMSTDKFKEMKATTSGRL